MATETTKLTYVEGAAASTPAATRVVTYAKSDGLMYSKDDAGVETLMSGGGGGSVATDAIWDAAGDLAVGSGANTAARLAIGATNGMALQRVSGAAAWALPPGFELDYVEFTSDVSVTGTNEAGANTVVTGTSQAYAAEPFIIHFFSPSVRTQATANAFCIILLYDGGTLIGWFGQFRQEAGTNSAGAAAKLEYRLTPTAATHQYIVKAYTSSGTSTVSASTGGTGAHIAGFIRITKV